MHLVLAGFPRISFLHSQAGDNDTQLWLTPAVLGVCTPWLLFKAFQEARLLIVALDPNEDRNVDTTESVIFLYKNLGCLLNVMAVGCMVFQVLKRIKLFCVSLSSWFFRLRVKMDDNVCC